MPWNSSFLAGVLYEVGGKCRQRENPAEERRIDAAANSGKGTTGFVGLGHGGAGREATFVRKNPSR